MNPDLYTNLALNGLIGILIGCYGTLVGAGGGFLLVPLFLLLHHLSPEVAVGTSLAIVAANAASGALGYVWKKKVDYRAGITFALATVPGAIAGTLLTSYFSGPIFMKVFGVFLIGISLYLFFRRKEEFHGAAKGPAWGRVQRELGGERYSYNEPVGLSISAGVGVVSSWLGIGGGIIHVPAMTEILGFPVHVAVATSHFVLAFTALVGAVVHAWSGHWDPTLAISTGVGAIIGAQIGVFLSPKLKSSAIIRYLSLALFAVGLRLVVS